MNSITAKIIHIAGGDIHVHISNLVQSCECNHLCRSENADFFDIVLSPPASNIGNGVSSGYCKNTAKYPNRAQPTTSTCLRQTGIVQAILLTVIYIPPPRYILATTKMRLGTIRSPNSVFFSGQSCATSSVLRCHEGSCRWSRTQLE